MCQLWQELPPEETWCAWLSTSAECWGDWSCTLDLTTKFTGGLCWDPCAHSISPRSDCRDTFWGLGASGWYLLVLSFWMDCAVFGRGEYHQRLIIVLLSMSLYANHALLFVLLPVLMFEYIYDVTTAKNIFWFKFDLKLLTNKLKRFLTITTSNAQWDSHGSFIVFTSGRRAVSVMAESVVSSNAVPVKTAIYLQLLFSSWRINLEIDNCYIVTVVTKAPVTHALKPVGDCPATKKQLQPMQPLCDQKLRFSVADQSATGRRQLSLKIGDQSVIGRRLVGDWLPTDWKWVTIGRQLVGDWSVTGREWVGDWLSNKQFSVLV